MTVQETQRSTSRVYAEVRRQLEAGTLTPGQRLPSLRALTARYAAPFRSVHQAILRLEHEGFLSVQHGRGIYALPRKPRTRTILLLSQTTGDEWSELTRGITERISSERDTRLLIETVPTEDGPSLESFRDKLRDILHAGVDAVLFNGLFGMRGECVVDLLREAEVPVVCFHSKDTAPDLPCGCAITDWRHGAYIGARHLIEIGCRNILLVVHTVLEDSPTHPVREFLHGCEEASEDSVHDVRLRQVVTRFDDPDLEARLSELFQDPADRPDGIFADADFRAARLMSALRRMGLEVPRDVAVLGYFDTPWTHMTEPHLSSITTRPAEIGAAAATLCLERRFHEQLVIRPRLVIRRSTRRGDSAPSSFTSTASSFPAGGGFTPERST